uniref:HD domain-containing protein n=1 Tax=Aureoumbra lagunensis TaxID=44058 RepID=A0A7S3NIT9_9STRA|mmetsp:Transcript_17493/g.22801  ORF Transcript_17493/g.22801 Transcript_17493/m.22801 type:complete len:624 (+) Transcript_17493:42-1913(+)
MHTMLGTPQNHRKWEEGQVFCSDGSIAVASVAPIPSLDKGRRTNKMIYDRVYGTINISALLVAVMDTEEFQRLDRVAQLGGSSYVYPTAKHTRKEHSIGVAHLAGKLIRKLRDAQPGLDIDADDISCIELAGLCHDLGHGPYSHMFDPFLNRAFKEHDRKYASHEERSIALLRRICDDEKRNLKQYFRDEDKFHLHINFACALITGLSDFVPLPKHEIGRDESKRFMFDIVANKRSGLDVDKFDYLLRDTFATMAQSKQIDISRIFAGSMVKKVNEKTQIIYEKKMLYDLYNVFGLRARLHRDVYQHRVSVVAEIMIIDILLEAEKSQFRIRGKTLSQAAEDLDTFILLTDSILDAIRMSDAPGLEKAHEILQRLASRNFYRAVNMPTKLECLPECPYCKKPTEFLQKFCAHCGTSTKERDFVCIKDEGNKKVIIPNNLARKKQDEWEQQIIDTVNEQNPDLHIEKSEIHVRLGSIKLGEKVLIEDPHTKGLFWSTYDPLAHSKFYNRKEEDCLAGHVEPKKYQGMFTAQATQELTLTCYYKGSDEFKIEPLQRAVKYVCGNSVEKDTHNFHSPRPSPAPSREHSLTIPSGNLKRVSQDTHNFDQSANKRACPLLDSPRFTKV